MSTRFTERLGRVLGTILAIMLSAAILGLPMQLLWNFVLVHAVSGVHEISWLDAVYLLLLLHLFKTPLATR